MTLRHRIQTWFSDRGIVIAAAALILPHLILVWNVSLPPLQDYPNHLARLHILSNADSEILRTFYEVSWDPIPNLALDAVVTFLAPFVGVATGTKLFVGVSLAGLVFGVLALQKALFGRLSAVSLFSSLLLFNMAFVKGFLGFTFATALALLTLALWLRLRDAAWQVRVALFSILTTILLFAHAFALGFYAVAVLSFEGVSACRQGRSFSAPAIKTIAVCVAPLVAPAAIFMTTSTGGALFQDITFRTLTEKLVIAPHLVAPYTREMMWLSMAALAVPLLIAFARLGARIDARVAGGAVALLAVYLAMPFVVGTSANADWRMLPQIALLLSAGISVDRDRHVLNLALA